MQFVFNPDHFPNVGGSIVTIGSFDGVHIGHRAIFRQLQQEAQKRQLKSVIITFAPHPQQVLQPDRNFIPINTSEQKIALISKEPVDYLLMIDFTLDFAAMTPEQFIQRILIQMLHTKAIVMGPNHAFGKNRSGTHSSVHNYCLQHHIDIIEIPEVIINDNSVRSTQIRQHLQVQEYNKASELLGYDYLKLEN